MSKWTSVLIRSKAAQTTWRNTCLYTFNDKLQTLWNTYLPKGICAGELIGIMKLKYLC